MLVLGIETSCDETAVSVVEDGSLVLSNTITSTKDIFADAGGVVPEDAARRQVECILPVLHGCLAESGVEAHDIDAIAVTRGPGLLGSLLVGTMAARVLSSLWEKPLIGVHHTFGHLSSIWLDSKEPPVFPSITLSASGGHTDLWYRSSHTQGMLLGRTRDDAAGEAFDKGARMLDLSYPGGPSIAKAAQDGDEQAFDFPLALQGEDTLDYSFSGLKTALKYTIRDLQHPLETVRNDLAASFQYAICLQLTKKIELALSQYSDVKEVHVVGGVSANIRLREFIATTLPTTTLRTPQTILYCTDNAAMIAAAGFFLHAEKGDEVFSPFETRATLPLADCVF